MAEQTLRDTLIMHLDTLRRNIEAVSLEVLKTRYRKPYLALRAEIAASATAYVKEITLGDLRIHRDYLPEAKVIIESAIEQSGLLKQIATAAFHRQNINEIDHLALTLKGHIENALAPFYDEHMGLWLPNGCLGSTDIAPILYNEVTGCILQNGKWEPLETDEKIYILPLHIQNHEHSAA